MFQKDKELFQVQKQNFCKSQKSHFSKGVNQCYWLKKCQFFHYLVWLKIRLEIKLNNVLDTKEPCFDYKRKISESPKNRIFPKRLTQAIGQKIPIFSLFVFGRNKTRNNDK